MSQSYARGQTGASLVSRRRRPGLLSFENIDGYVFQSAANLLRDQISRDRSRIERGGVEPGVLNLIDDVPDAEQVVGESSFF